VRRIIQYKERIADVYLKHVLPLTGSSVFYLHRNALFTPLNETVLQYAMYVLLSYNETKMSLIFICSGYCE
jgi:hypothetical protein